MADSSAPEQRVLARFGLAQLAVAEQLVFALKRFRAAQLRDLDTTVAALPDHVVAHMQAHFDRKLDVKDELERYTHDLLKATHLARHLQLDDDAQREIETLMGALGDGNDRALLLKMLQSLGARPVRVLCGLCLQLPQIRLQSEVYRTFAATDVDLKQWMQWLESCRPNLQSVYVFLSKCTSERCLGQWLLLLNPLASSVRLSVIDRLISADAPLLKQVGRFHEVTGLSIVKLLDLCSGFQAQLPMLLNEFPMATTLSLYAKFNDDRLIDTVVKALYLLGKGEVIRLVDALATEENARAISVFFVSMTGNERRRAIASLYLSLSKPSQSRLLELTLQAAGTEDEESLTPSIVYTFVLDGHLHSIDDVLRKTLSVPTYVITALLTAMRRFATDEFVLLGEGLEAIHDQHCIEAYFRLFTLLLPAQRSILVEWIHDTPGADALQLYDKLFQLHASAQVEKFATLLKMIGSLKKTDKLTLCTRLLRRPSSDEDAQSVEQTNDAVLNYLCECDPSRRHKCVKLLDATDRASFDTLLFLLRTQRKPEQVALTKVMLSLSPVANGRLLEKLHGLDGESLDEFFQLLMLIPKVEYKMLSRLLVSPEVSLHQFQDFVHVAANMMNQAATREMVTFAAELPPKYRNMFFEMLGQCTPAEKGVVMRIVACSTRLSPDVLQLFVEILLRMSWETRSALVEQLRALEDPVHIQTYVVILREFDDDACLPRMVHLLNLLAIPVRISLVTLFAQVSSACERVQALGKLNAMRKDQMPPYCTALCDLQHLHHISCSYLRVLGYLQDEYQTGMLRLLPRKSCWVFIEVLVEAMNNTNSTDADQEDCMAPNRALVNGLATSLTTLSQEEDYVLLGDVMEEAMENGTRLEELIVVLAHFRDRDRLLVFLKYVAHLARFAHSTLFFRVLSRSAATAFLFDMCHVLDVDDALFALKRLDRMHARDPSAVDSMLIKLAQSGSAVDSRDEFCNLVLGYRERTPSESTARNRDVDQVLVPPSAPRPLESTAEHSWSKRPLDLEVGGFDQPFVDLGSTTTDSCRPISTMKQLERVRDKREDARRRRRCRNWREWTRTDWEDVLQRTEQVPERGSQITGTTEVLFSATSPELAPELPDSCSKEFPETSGDHVDTAETNSAFRPPSSTSSAVLPPILPQLLPAQALTRPPSGNNNRTELMKNNLARDLARCESAPTVLQPSNVSRSKQCRGLHAALGMGDADAHHAPRDRGTSIFHTQCEFVISHAPSRIRFAHTEAAHARVLAARVDKALGRRANAVTRPKPSLERSERRTIEQAAAAVAQSEHFRTLGAGDFVEWSRSGD